MISRDRAELARDAAYNALTAQREHRNECDKCDPHGVPCELGSMLQRGVIKFAKEASDALTAYLPRGTRVTYNGKDRARHGNYTIAGPAIGAAWGAFTLERDGHRFTASLASVQLMDAEEEARDRLMLARDVAATVGRVLAAHRYDFAVSVERTDHGTVFVAWSSVEFLAIERRAGYADAAARQYVTAAIGLLEALRAATNANQWRDVQRLADSARSLAERSGANARP
ncbi:hypothetical protein ACOZ38_25365 [Sphaerisporangium viridialbum]|uniref:hypothetical protein n=1 Tax=Sphaerisporangium viridialbum TaxID=46189 RepID=UPI003C71AB44